MNNTITLKIRCRDRNIISDWLQHFNESIKQMDVTLLKNILDDDMALNDQSKWEFLAYLRNCFEEFKAIGVAFLKPGEEICLICHAGKIINFFQAHEGKGIGFKLEFENENLKDITICNFSTGCMKENEKLSWYKSYNYKHKS